MITLHLYTFTEADYTTDGLTEDHTKTSNELIDEENANTMESNPSSTENPLSEESTTKITDTEQVTTELNNPQSDDSTTETTSELLPPDSTETSSGTTTTDLGVSVTPSSSRTSCKENEEFSCLPLCAKTCTNLLSKIICIPYPFKNSDRCRKGCHCQNGYFKDRTTGNCVQECPYRKPSGIDVNVHVQVGKK